MDLRAVEEDSRVPSLTVNGKKLSGNTELSIVGGEKLSRSLEHFRLQTLQLQ